MHQNRKIDTLYYLDKSKELMDSLYASISTIDNLRKLSLAARKESKEEKTKTNSSENEEFRAKMNEGNNLRQLDFCLNSYDLELLHNCSQIVPTLDRTGRFLSGKKITKISLCISLTY